MSGELTPEEECRTEGAVFALGRIAGKYDVPDRPGKPGNTPEKERANRIAFLTDDHGEKAATWFDAGANEVADAELERGGGNGSGRTNLLSNDKMVTAAPLLTRLSDVKQLAVEWLWPRRIPQGMLTILFGDAGLGKSHLWQDIVTRISTGAVWPDGGRAPLGNSVVLSAEDDISRVIVPRLTHSGADLFHVFCFASVADFDRKGRRTFSLTRDVAQLEEAILLMGAIFAVVDPLTAYLDGVNSNAQTEVRAALVMLSDVAERTGAAVLCIMHPNKNEGRGTKALYRLAGSGAFGAAPRSVMLIAEDEDRKDEGRRLLLPVKLNIAAKPPGLGFRITAASPDTCESAAVWDHDPVEVDADEALGCGRTDSPVIEQASDFLRAALADGDWHPASDLYAEAEQHGIGERTLKRAKGPLGVQYRKLGFPSVSEWRLNVEDS